MSDDGDLVQRVAESSGLAAGEARRVIDDVLAYYREPVEDYVRRRHSSLAARGAKNPEIFARIADELSRRVVAPPDLSERQIRRLVYG